jgi:ribonuclease J
LSAVTLTVHRGTRQIGGNCIEVKAQCDRLVLDVGRPLDASPEATGLLPDTLDRDAPAHVLISHPHQDHWGLLDEVPAHWSSLRGGRREADMLDGSAYWQASGA